MSVIVKGMEMPKNCDTCWALDDYGDYPRCRITGEQRGYNFPVRERRMDNCPLIELPPHGRLIDVDEPMTKISTMMQEPDYQHDGENWMVGLIMARDAIDDAPTVIEAEGSET